MIAADIAFTTDEPIDALVLLSPTIVNEAAWRAGMPRRRGLRVFVSHGRRDTILPFDASVRLQQAMRDAGLRVTWFPFDGGHEMPAVRARDRPQRFPRRALGPCKRLAGGPKTATPRSGSRRASPRRLFHRTPRAVRGTESRQLRCQATRHCSANSGASALRYASEQRARAHQ